MLSLYPADGCQPNRARAFSVLYSRWRPSNQAPYRVTRGGRDLMSSRSLNLEEKASRERERVRDLPGDAGDLERIGEQVKELALGDPALAGDIVGLTPRARIVRRQDRGVGHDSRRRRRSADYLPCRRSSPGPVEIPEPVAARSFDRARRRASSAGSRSRGARPRPFPRASARNRPCCACNNPGPRCSVPEAPTHQWEACPSAGWPYALVELIWISRSIASLSGGLGENAGGIDAPGLKLVPPSPITDLGRAMIHACDAGHGRLACRSIRQVAAYDFDAERVQKIGAAIGTNQGANPFALGNQPLGQMTPQEARGPGDQSLVTVRYRWSFTRALIRGD